MKKLLFVYLLNLIFITVYAGNLNHLRGQRYCEILLAKNILSNKIHVYNTIGLNTCPANIWDTITPKIIKQQTDNGYVHLNGPRYWMIDGLQNSNLVSTQVKVLGNLPMREAGILQLNLKDKLSHNVPYIKHRVLRQTTWVYESGKPIYEIINSEGEAFVMQSYSVQKVPQNENSLANLGTQLNLPRGWRFHSRILVHNHYLTPDNNIAIVIQDERLNTYQQETTSFK